MMLTKNGNYSSRFHEKSEDKSKLTEFLPFKVVSEQSSCAPFLKTFEMEPPNDKTNFHSYWISVQNFSLLETACLWCGIDPSDELVAQRAKSKLYPIERLLWEAILDFELPVKLRVLTPDKPGATQKIYFDKWIQAFELSEEQIEASKAKVQISRSDLERFASSIGQRPPFLFLEQDHKTQSSLTAKCWENQLDPIIRLLQIRFENDEMIVIKGPDGNTFSYHCKQLGFRDSNVKTWRFLREFLTCPDEGFNFGKPYSYSEGYRKIKNRDYDAKWKLCDELCKKLIVFFNREYGWNLPLNYKLYEELQPGNRTRYKFKFDINKPMAEDRLKVGNAEPPAWHKKFLERCRNLTEEALVLEVLRLSSDFDLTSIPDETIPEKLIIAYEVGKEVYNWSDERFKGFIMK